MMSETKSSALRSVVIAALAILGGIATPFFLGLQLGLMVLLYGLAAATTLRLVWSIRERRNVASRFILTMIVVLVAALVGSVADIALQHGFRTIPISIVAVSVLFIVLEVRGYRYFTQSNRTGGR